MPEPGVVVARLLAGAVVAGVPSSARPPIYAEAARRSAGLRAHLLTTDKRRAHDLTGDIRKLTGGGFVVAELTTAPQTQPAIYDADLVVGAVETLATDFLYATLHGPPHDPLPQLDVAILDDADTLAIEFGGRAAAPSAPGIPLLDRIGYPDYFRQYQLVCGVTDRLAPDAAAEISSRFGLDVDGATSAGSSEEGRWRGVLSGPRKGRASRTARLRRRYAEAYRIEADQRETLVEYRRHLLGSFATPAGVAAVFTRWAETADPDEVDLVRRKLAERTQHEGEGAIQQEAIEAVRQLIPHYWREHLRSLDDLAADLRGPGGPVADLPTYATRAHDLYQQMLQEVHAHFVHHIASDEGQSQAD